MYIICSLVVLTGPESSMGSVSKSLVFFRYRSIVLHPHDISGVKFLLKGLRIVLYENI